MIMEEELKSQQPSSEKRARKEDLLKEERKRKYESEEHWNKRARIDSSDDDVMIIESNSTVTSPSKPAVDSISSTLPGYKPTAISSLVAGPISSAVSLFQQLRLIRLPASNSNIPLSKQGSQTFSPQALTHSSQVPSTLVNPNKPIRSPSPNSKARPLSSSSSRTSADSVTLNKKRDQAASISSLIRDNSSSPSPTHPVNSRAHKGCDFVSPKKKLKSPQPPATPSSSCSSSPSTPPRSSTPITKKSHPSSHKKKKKKREEPIIIIGEWERRTRSPDSHPCPKRNKDKTIQQKTLLSYFSPSQVKTVKPQPKKDYSRNAKKPVITTASVPPVAVTASSSTKTATDSNDINQVLTVSALSQPQGMFMVFESLGVWYKVYRDEPCRCFPIDPPTIGE